MNRKYIDTIVRHYESCLEKYGDSHKGVDWPNPEDARLRYRVMLEIIDWYRSADDSKTLSILDFGCGAGHLLEFMNSENAYPHIHYSGLDISDKYVSLSKRKFPEYTFFAGDILSDSFSLPHFDFIILNGVFTEKREMTFEEMWEYFQQLVTAVFSYARAGIAFNVMSKAVDWERDDLFHLPADLLINFLAKKISRHFIIRNDYGLYEYTVYLYRTPNPKIALNN